MDSWEPAQEPVPTTGTVVYADAFHGSDDNAGSKDKPFKTLVKAIESVKGETAATVVLRKGTFYTDTINLGPEHSGLTGGGGSSQADGDSGSVSSAGWKIQAATG